MNNTSSAERINISFFGSVNSGKSSLMNAITAQEISIVSDVKGTTTDPVRKAVELLPIGAVMLYDTAGFDDESPASELRMKKTKEILRITDLAVLVTDITSEMSNSDNDMLEAFKQQGIPYIIVHSKADLNQQKKIYPYGEAAVSSKTGSGIEELKELICSVYLKSLDENKPLYKNVTDGLAAHKSIVILVTPIDASAPKGRLILPQVQTIRSLLDSFAVTMTVQPSELSTSLEILCRKPDLVITDSQAFSYVKDIVPNDVPLTSFSILFARYKGMLPQVLEGIRVLKYLNDGECILISEGCTHHRQCGDIARDKLPLWIENFTEKKLNFEFTSGGTFPQDLRKYALIVHCGGCMLSTHEIDYRRRLAKSQGIPFTNYGILISAINGMLERSTRFIQK